MKAMLFALQILGFVDEARAIRLKWDELITISGSKPDPEYKRCYPESLLQQIAEVAVAGVKGIGCQVAELKTDTVVYSLLNQAWTEFWKDSKEYIAWERKAVYELRSLPFRSFTASR
jgi:hypothetical protein